MPILDARRKDKIKSEMKRAEDYLQSADILHRSGLYTPSVTASYFAAMHASVAAFLTAGTNAVGRESTVSFVNQIRKFNDKLDPFVEKALEERDKWRLNASFDYAENEALLRLFQTREFCLEVKDFLRRAVKI